MNSKKQVYFKEQLISFILFLAMVLFSAGCAKQAEPETITGFYFDTFITITLYQQITPEIREEVLNLCETYENMFSAEIEQSDIYKINHAAGEPVAVNIETIELIQTAIYYAAKTGGKCDPTIYPVSSLWDFSSESSIIPDENLLSEKLTHVNYQNIILSETTVTLTDPQAAIDLGFIAKGYIADKLKEYFISKDITLGIINLGGNILTINNKPDGSPYRIGIDYPFKEQSLPILTLHITDLSVVTSGIYQRYFTKDDIIYHHLLDTKSGYPSNQGLYSVTIIGSSSAICDALSTAVYLCGPEDGMELINQTDGYEAVFVTDQYELLFSDDAEQYISD